MTEAEIQYFRRRLLELKKRRAGTLAELEEQALRGLGGEASGSLSDLPNHTADLGTANYDEEVKLDLLENEAEILTEINDALERIERRSFGRCEECGKEINRERLKALPYARHCLRDAKRIQARAER